MEDICSRNEVVGLTCSLSFDLNSYTPFFSGATETGPLNVRLLYHLRLHWTRFAAGPSLHIDMR